MKTVIKIKLQNNQQNLVIIHIRTLTHSTVTRSFALRQDRLSSVICLKICFLTTKELTWFSTVRIDLRREFIITTVVTEKDLF